MEKDYSVTYELICLAFNIRKEVCGVLDNIFFFKKNLMQKKTHNMLILMLDPKFLKFHSMSSFIRKWIMMIVWIFLK
jgi:hypothetical protein